MDRTSLPAARAFIDDVRALFAEPGLDETERWEKVRERLRPLLDDPDPKAAAAAWPDTDQPDGGPGNLLFYEDPDYGFVLNALIKKPLGVTSVHDHGPSWTVYGVIEGGERVVGYAKTEAASGTVEVTPQDEHEVGPGYIDFVPPWQVHAEFNGPRRTVAVIVRSQRSGTFDQYRFDPESGAAMHYHGPVQIPHDLG